MRHRSLQQNDNKPVTVQTNLVFFTSYYTWSKLAHILPATKTFGSWSRWGNALLSIWHLYSGLLSWSATILATKIAIRFGMTSDMSPTISTCNDNFQSKILLSRVQHQERVRYMYVNRQIKIIKDSVRETYVRMFYVLLVFWCWTLCLRKRPTALTQRYCRHAYG